MVLKKHELIKNEIISHWQLTYKIDWNEVVCICNSIYEHMDFVEVYLFISKDFEKLDISSKVETNLLFLAKKEYHGYALEIKGLLRKNKKPFGVKLYSDSDMCEVMIHAFCIDNWTEMANKELFLYNKLGHLLNSMEMVGIYDADNLLMQESNKKSFEVIENEINYNGISCKKCIDDSGKEFLLIPNFNTIKDVNKIINLGFRQFFTYEGMRLDL